MREIKFRAWTGEKMRSCSVSIDGKAMMDFGPSNAPLMQFTGLHDKNGREIYEEDILSRPYVNGINTEQIVRVVVADEYGWNLRDYAVSICAVIGNIYESPELLK